MSARTRALFVGSILAVFGGWGLTGEKAPDHVDQAQARALAALRKESRSRLVLRLAGGVVRSLEAELRRGATDDPRDAALAFLERYRHLYRLGDPRAELYLLRHARDLDGGEHLAFGQLVAGVPVVGAAILVHLEPGWVQGSNGNYLAPPPAAFEVRLSPQHAQMVAQRQTKLERAEAIGEPALRVLAPALLGLEGAPRLAWRTTLRGKGRPALWTAFVDAVDGRLLLEADLERHYAPAKSFSIQGALRTDSDICWAFGGPVAWFDQSGPLPSYPGPVGDWGADGMNAWAFLHQTYDFFHGNFDRHGWNGADGTQTVIVHRGPPGSGRASFGCNLLSFAEGMVDLDVFAHEYTHAVVAHTAALDAVGEPRALDESYADVMGVLVEGRDGWLIGEGTMPPDSRNLDDPTAEGRPDHVLAEVSGDGQGLRRLGPGESPSAANEWGYAYTNLTIPNKAATLLADGGTHHGIHVLGLGRERAAQLLYSVLATRLWSGAQFPDARDAAVAQARHWARSGRRGFGTGQVCGVINAYASVGLGRADLDCDGQDDGEDLDDDGDGHADDRDNCPSLANPGQGNFDGRPDGGDACDEDDDQDGRADEVDTCDVGPRPEDDADPDGDGIGDGCDDDDRDGWLNSADNCRDAANPGQLNTDAASGDPLGDACDEDDDGDSFPDESDVCPLQVTSSQVDTDLDGRGNECDICDDVPDPEQRDNDGDGEGDACDSDDDNDRVPDAVDNCPWDPNTDQWNLDGIGPGTACDVAEREAFFSRQEASGVVALTRLVRLPIPPCLKCGGWLREGSGLAVRVSYSQPLRARIVDEQGLVVTWPAADGRSQELALLPGADAHYVFPSQQGVFRGRRYFLELAPAPGSQGGSGLLTLKLVRGKRE